MTYSELINEGIAELNSANITEAVLDARLLLEYICGTDHNTLWAHPEREVSEREEEQYRQALLRRALHIPLQHITGSQEFMGIEFVVNKDVLIPRQDTELLVEEAMKYIEDGMRVLDMCTGSGCVLLSIMNYKNDLYGIGTDISEGALNIARENAKRIDVSGNVKFIQGDMYEAIEGDDEVKGLKFDVIVSNPPYITPDDIDTLMPEVKDHDPYIALCGGDDGLEFYRKIAKDANKYLVNYGKIFLEIGYDQKDAVISILKCAGFSDVICYNDYSGNPRVVIGTYIENAHV